MNLSSEKIMGTLINSSIKASHSPSRIMSKNASEEKFIDLTDGQKLGKEDYALSRGQLKDYILQMESFNADVQRNQRTKQNFNFFTKSKIDGKRLHRERLDRIIQNRFRQESDVF